MKICSKCKTKKDFVEFYNLKRSKDGLMSHCKLCDKSKTSSWAKNNKDKHNARSRRWTKNNPEKITIKNSCPKRVLARKNVPQIGRKLIKSMLIIKLKPGEKKIQTNRPQYLELIELLD